MVSTLEKTAQKVKEILLTNAKILVSGYKNVQILNPCLYAGSGFGKTTIVEMIANDKDFLKEYSSYFGLNQTSAHVEKLLLQTYLPEEVMGVPKKIANITYWTIPAWFDKLLKTSNENKVPILFLDELDKPRKDAISTVLTLLSSRELRGLKLPQHTIIICAMQNVDYTPEGLIEDRTIEALWRRLVFVNIDLADIEVFDIIPNVRVVINKDSDLYRFSTFNTMRSGYGEYRAKNPVVPFISPREISYLLAFVDAYLSRKPELKNKIFSLSVEEGVKELTKEIGNLIYYKCEIKGSDESKVIDYIEYISQIYLLSSVSSVNYDKFIFEASSYSLDTIMELAKIAAYEKSFSKLDFLAYVASFSPHISAFPKALSYLILVIPSDVIKEYFGKGHFRNLVLTIGQKFKYNYIRFMKEYIGVKEGDLIEISNFPTYDSMSSSEIAIFYPTLLKAYKEAPSGYKARIYRREVYKFNLFSLIYIGTTILLKQILSDKIDDIDLFASTYASTKGIIELMNRYGIDNFCDAMANDVDNHIQYAKEFVSYYKKANTLIEDGKLTRTIGIDKDILLFSEVIDVSPFISVSPLLPDIDKVISSVSQSSNISEEVVEDIKKINKFALFKLDEMDNYYNDKEIISTFIKYLNGVL